MADKNALVLDDHFNPVMSHSSSGYLSPADVTTTNHSEQALKEECSETTSSVPFSSFPNDWSSAVVSAAKGVFQGAGTVVSGAANYFWGIGGAGGPVSLKDPVTRKDTDPIIPVTRWNWYNKPQHRLIHFSKDSFHRVHPTAAGVRGEVRATYFYAALKKLEIDTNSKRLTIYFKDATPAEYLQCARIEEFVRHLVNRAHLPESSIKFAEGCTTFHLHEQPPIPPHANPIPPVGVGESWVAAGEDMFFSAVSGSSRFGGSNLRVVPTPQGSSRQHHGNPPSMSVHRQTSRGRPPVESLTKQQQPSFVDAFAYRSSAPEAIMPVGSSSVSPPTKEPAHRNLSAGRFVIDNASQQRRQTYGSSLIDANSPPRKTENDSKKHAADVPRMQQALSSPRTEKHVGAEDHRVVTGSRPVQVQQANVLSHDAKVSHPMVAQQQQANTLAHASAKQEVISTPSSTTKILYPSLQQQANELSYDAVWLGHDNDVVVKSSSAASRPNMTFGIGRFSNGSPISGEQPSPAPSAHSPFPSSSLPPVWNSPNLSATTPDFLSSPSSLVPKDVVTPYPPATSLIHAPISLTSSKPQATKRAELLHPIPSVPGPSFPQQNQQPHPQPQPTTSPRQQQQQVTIVKSPTVDLSSLSEVFKELQECMGGLTSSTVNKDIGSSPVQLPPPSSLDRQHIQDDNESTSSWSNCADHVAFASLSAKVLGGARTQQSSSSKNNNNHNTDIDSEGRKSSTEWTDTVDENLLSFSNEQPVVTWGPGSENNNIVIPPEGDLFFAQEVSHVAAGAVHEPQTQTASARQHEKSSPSSVGIMKPTFTPSAFGFDYIT
eukprot:CAMPEP_0184336638 /NCGR_PEP_ID=MMETSP1089-20130417/4849_1 /TAXON_ID=38269 ORGANISM="Gloeochaete wittrockiana, Strain SAG46.84" /NCGR_SAMPLE_ID=MMETSP1089 /ASSEMBLY_ACC=CAM_ASM_000445 /LENGTH=827 /DNA_ID=CAMNT_0026661691 /DNA_START=282 /DNA_END=2766 /DNA_ORIENTATION=+